MRQTSAGSASSSAASRTPVTASRLLADGPGRRGARRAARARRPSAPSSGPCSLRYTARGTLPPRATHRTLFRCGVPRGEGGSREPCFALRARPWGTLFRLVGPATLLASVRDPAPLARTLFRGRVSRRGGGGAGPRARPPRFGRGPCSSSFRGLCFAPAGGAWPGRAGLAGDGDPVPRSPPRSAARGPCSAVGAAARTCSARWGWTGSSPGTLSPRVWRGRPRWNPVSAEAPRRDPVPPRAGTSGPRGDPVRAAIPRTRRTLCRSHRRAG